MRTTNGSPYTPFSVTAVPDRDKVRVVVVGELDLGSADAVRAAVEELRAAGFGEILLDLREVDFVDSMGLRMLLALSEDARCNGHRLTLAGPRPSAQKIFDLTATRHLFDWRDAPAAPQPASSDRGGPAASA